MASGLGLPFEVGGPSLGWLQVRKVIFCDYRVNPRICGPIVSAVPWPRGEACTTSPTGLPRFG
jgi:hypothetical protein